MVVDVTQTARYAEVAVSLTGLRQRAVRFSERFSDARSERQEAQTFWRDFFGIFGIDTRTVGSFELKAQRASTGGQGRIDFLWSGEVAIEHKSRGEDLEKAMDQALDYLPSLTPAEMPWLIIACDFERFFWRDLNTGDSGTFLLYDLVDNLELFAWMAGHKKPGHDFSNIEDVNLKATALLATIHDRLDENGYGGHDLRVWLTRILFCLFAEDAGVFSKAAFHSYIALHTRDDGSNLGSTIAELFQWLNVPVEARPQALDEQLRHLTYINGDLFEEGLPIPVCDEAVRDALLEACKFDWSRISPVVFGSMFQNVMQPAERRQLGAHYTSERDIMRTIGPLFIDDLGAELNKATTKPLLRAFLDKLAALRFFDPACGCGNFLILAYREVRRLETEALRQLRAKEGREDDLALDLTLECRVRVDQFYGIEIEEFPARIARTALYLMDHLVNRAVSKEFGQQLLRFPIPASPHIVVANALVIDWNDVLPAQQAHYVFGNPPFGGHAYRTREQSAELQRLWAAGYGKWLDYVTGWYRKALEYGGKAPVEFAFVSTNSISQGEQVARLWQPLQDAGYHITFAHQPFAWTSEAKGRANVHVVIVGFRRGASGTKLYTYAAPKADPVLVRARNISPYLVDGPNTAVAGRSTPLSEAMPLVRYGSLPSDGGALVVLPEDVPTDDPVAMKYIRPYLGSREVLHGEERFCLWMPHGPAPGDRKASPFLEQRLQLCRDNRLQSRNPDTIDLADQPYRFFHNAQPAADYLGIPAQVSESRRWYTVKHLTPDFVASNTLYTAEDPDGFLFGVLSSTMFVTWVGAIGGRLKGDLRYAKSIVHNTFPLPNDVPVDRRSAVIAAGKELLLARIAHPGASLADLYDPLATPPEILLAHQRIDKAVDAVFNARKRQWTPDERLSHLLEAYAARMRSGPVL